MKVLIANRGEIAVRIIRACRELGYPTVAVYSEADRTALHVLYADQAVLIGPPPSSESYLRIDRVIEAARRTGARAVHPGYGFLAENAAFAQGCKDAGLIFIGPSVRSIEAMGSKVASRQLMRAAGVPIVPGLEAGATFEEIERFSREAGYPVMVKASAGGGGKGMRQVQRPEDLQAAFDRVRSEARSFFGDDTVYVEKVVQSPRHIEVQILGDQSGNIIHLGERECTLQRRHQKVVEESPSPVVDAELRARIGETAVRAAAAVDYYSAGTIEFLMGADRQFYFLEMNTRLQVEHPVTEAVTGIDLVKEQLRIATGGKLDRTQDQVRLTGHAIECRIYAEDPQRNFAPSPGLIRYLNLPEGPGVRNDNGVYSGFRVPLNYDPMLSKLIAFGSDRDEAIARMHRALSEYRVDGIRTTIPFYLHVMKHPDFRAGNFDTSFIDRLLPELQFETADDMRAEAAMVAAAILAFEESERTRLPADTTSRWRAAARSESTSRERT
jgi:acetyl-CoA carboxylase biotin carboxylase subunit